MLATITKRLRESANERLIEAAPDLLAAAKAKLQDCRESGPCLYYEEYCSDECIALAAAIAKATGGGE